MAGGRIEGDRLESLAVSGTGFVFDPATGHTYTLNRTGLDVLRLLREGVPPGEIGGRLADRYEVAAHEAERDAALFVARLREFRLR